MQTPIPMDDDPDPEPDSPPPTPVAASIHRSLLCGQLAGTSILYFQIPFCLAERPQSARELANSLGVERQSVHNRLSELQEAGFVERAPEASMGRVRRYRLSESPPDEV